MSDIKNYFEFFGLKEQFDLNVEELRKSFIANSKKFHPDFHTHASDEDQEKVLELATINNEAWKVLSDLQHRISHILKLNDEMPEEGKAEVSQDFLMEMMDINEALMDLEFEEDDLKKQALLKSLQELEDSIHAEGESAMKIWDESNDPSSLAAVRDYYLKLKYIRRIQEQIR